MKNSFFFLRPNLYLKLKKKKGIHVRNEIFFLFYSLSIHIRNQLIFFGFVSIGTNRTRTRSFHLDRAVLWPIELQSQGKSCIAYIFLLFHSNPLFFYFRFEPLYCNWKRQTYILIFLWVCTLSEIDTDYSQSVPYC